jgi:hypothetical protein
VSAGHRAAGVDDPGYNGTMRISWLSPDTVRAARAALESRHRDWGAHFQPEFVPGPAPAGIDAAGWPRIAEHVARAEHVGHVVREHGLDEALARFRHSEHAIELATVTAAAMQTDRATFEMVEALLLRDVDEGIAYGGFLELLQTLGRDRRERAVEVYERFCAAFASKVTHQPMWAERVAAVRDGLAAYYTTSGRHEQAHALYLERHAEERDTLVVVLGASRAFLAAGEVGRAILWLGLGAERAEALGRPDMTARLRAKQEALRARQS